MKFVQCTSIQYDKLDSKDIESLYFTSDTNRLFKGNNPLNCDINILTKLPSTGRYNTLYLVDTKLYIWYKYIAYEDKEHPDVETIKEDWLCINEYTDQLNDDIIVKTTVAGDITKQYIDYKFNHAPIYHIDAANVKYDNKNIDNKEMKSMQDVVDFAFKNL